MAKERKIRRRQTLAQEQRKIERLLGEEFDSLAQARRALKKESVPAVKSTPKAKPKSKPISKLTRKEKHQLALKIGKKEYTKRLRNWERNRLEHEEDLALQPDDNPYFYHVKE